MTKVTPTSAVLSPDDVTPAAVDEITAKELARRPSWFRRHESLMLPVIALVVILTGWEIYGRVVGFNPLFFSYPSGIWEGFVDLAEGPLIDDLRVSGHEFVVGLGFALAGIPLGMLIGSIRRVRLALDPIINGLYATPTLALTPLFVIWFGLGITSKVAIVAIMAFFPLIISTVEGVKTVDPSLLRATRSFGARRWHLYIDVVLPSIVPFIISGLRLAIGRAIIGVVIGEFIGATAGVGYRIRANASVFRTNEYLAGIAVLVVAAVALNLLLRAAEGRLAPWRRARETD